MPYGDPRRGLEPFRGLVAPVLPVWLPPDSRGETNVELRRLPRRRR